MQFVTSYILTTLLREYLIETLLMFLARQLVFYISSLHSCLLFNDLTMGGGLLILIKLSHPKPSSLGPSFANFSISTFEKTSQNLTVCFCKIPFLLKNQKLCCTKWTAELMDNSQASLTRQNKISYLTTPTISDS